MALDTKAEAWILYGQGLFEILIFDSLVEELKLSHVCVASLERVESNLEGE